MPSMMTERRERRRRLNKAERHLGDAEVSLRKMAHLLIQELVVLRALGLEREEKLLDAVCVRVAAHTVGISAEWRSLADMRAALLDSARK